MTAMVYAARLSSLAMATLLLSAGADVNVAILKEYIVGTLVTVDYLNRGKWKPGKIHSIRPDKSYDIKFDDGCSEIVKKERVRLAIEDGMIL